MTLRNPQKGKVPDLPELEKASPALKLKELGRYYSEVVLAYIRPRAQSPEHTEIKLEIVTLPTLLRSARFPTEASW